MPIPLLIALFVAFGFDAPAAAVPLDWPVVWWRVGEAGAGVLAVAAFAFGLGRLVAYRVARRGRASSRVRWAYSAGVRAADALSVVVFAWVIHGLDWPVVVRSGLGLGDPVLLDDVLILLPFLLAELAGWWGVYAAERALWPRRGPGPLGRYLWLKARQSFGMVLPLAGLFALGTELAHRRWPSLAASRWDQPLSLVLMGVIVLVLAPAFIRIAWPTRPLPPGPLRDRLEHLSRRLGFRCTDILVWDTNRLIVNAGVTGSLPRFRYVLLTDALVENLEPIEVAAAFGHEVGHVAHRHLVFFGFFLVGSLGVLASFAEPLRRFVPDWVLGDSTAALATQIGSTVVLLGGYFLLAFGFLSRRFERQADVFGCRAVSCGRADCPPHADLDGRPDLPVAYAGADGPTLCPVGVRTFVNALATVAALNGMNPDAWSWRHGSITRRITFLEGLVNRPEAERQFQRGIRRLRLGLAVAIAAAVAALTVSAGYWPGP